MFIDGIAISGYRSFGNTLQKIGPFGKVNLLAGQNNSGKSNILLFLSKELHKYLKATRERGDIQIPVEPLDQHQGDRIARQRFGLALKLGGRNHAKIMEMCRQQYDSLPSNYGEQDRELSTQFIRRVLTSSTLIQDTQAAWFTYCAPRQSNDLFALPDNLIEDLHNELKNPDREILHTHQTLYDSGARSHRVRGYIELLREILDFISPHRLELPEVHLIPAIRKIGDAGSDYEDYSGAGIIRRLHQLQSPVYDKQHLKDKFQKINAFLQNVTGDETATLEIPYDESMIMAHMGKRSLPLSSLGTGIHEVVILAAAATVLEKQILCVEEPELHLHPLLQRKLIRYLKDNTDNQYFLTTHSAHFLDEPDVQIFHVRHQEGKSTVDPVHTPVQRSAICADLGYRASDLVQANSIIWVEGPSDRIYLKYWIRACDPNLVEGLHYSIMFYGGRLLSHLTANDPEIEEFISLRRLNRYISILIDSDRNKSGQTINSTKKRVQSEFDEGPGFAWITKGREIENYIVPTLLEECVKAVHKNAVRLDKTGQFDHALPYVTKIGDLKPNVDKVKVAHEIAKHPADLDFLDLKKMMKKLINFIEQANEF